MVNNIIEKEFYSVFDKNDNFLYQTENPEKIWDDYNDYDHILEDPKQKGVLLIMDKNNQVLAKVKKNSEIHVYLSM